MMTFIIIVLTVLTGGVLLEARKNKRMKEKYARAARKFKLKLNGDDPISNPELTGQVGDFFVQVQYSCLAGMQASYDCYQVTFPVSLDFTFSLTVKEWLNRYLSAGGEDAFSSGDTEFDRIVHCITGSKEKLLARLNFRCRKALIQFALLAEKGEFSVSERNIRVTLADYSLETALHDLISLGRELTRPGSLFDLLYDNFCRDSFPGVRLNNLKALLYHFPHLKGDSAFMDRVFLDRNPVICFTAFKANPSRAYLRHLYQFWPGSNPVLKKEILLFLGKDGKEFYANFLAYQFRYEVPRLREELLDTIGKIASPGMSDFLVKQLEDPDFKIVLAAIRALGYCGSSSAVTALKELSHPALKVMVRRTLEQIHSRIKDKSEGWLSLSETGEEGSLGFPGGSAAGELSLDPGEKEVSLEGRNSRAGRG